MSTALICERWPLEVEPGGEPERWFLDWVQRSPREASAHVTAGYHAYAALADLGLPVATAVEAFGGLGCQSLMIQNLWRPERHIIQEVHPAGAAHLRRNLGRAATVRCADSYASALPPADLYGLDFGDLTVHSAQRRHRPLLDAVFAQRPMGVVLTDIAGPRLQLHRARYAADMGHPDYPPVSYPDYLAALCSWLYREWGYVLTAGFYHRWSSVLALVPEQPGWSPRGVIEPVPETPKGIQLG